MANLLWKSILENAWISENQIYSMQINVKFYICQYTIFGRHEISLWKKPVSCQKSQIGKFPDLIYPLEKTRQKMLDIYSGFGKCPTEKSRQQLFWNNLKKLFPQQHWWDSERWWALARSLNTPIVIRFGWWGAKKVVLLFWSDIWCSGISTFIPKPRKASQSLATKPRSSLRSSLRETIFIGTDNFHYHFFSGKKLCFLLMLCFLTRPPRAQNDQRYREKQRNFMIWPHIYHIWFDFHIVK